MSSLAGVQALRRHFTFRLAAALLLVLAVLSPIGGSARADTANQIVTENQQPGTSAWRITQTVSDDVNNQMRGYASATSVNVGGLIALNTTVNPAQSYVIDIYRVGYYQGLGGRLMQHIGSLAGTPQPSCPLDLSTGMVACNWAAGYTLTVPTTWTSGIYLAKLTNASSYQSYIIFTVRDDGRHSNLLFQQSVTTYQAYNNYPNDVPSGGTKPLTGKSLYEYNSSTALTASGTTRAVKISFDRPYSNDDGAGDFLDWEFNLVRWAERTGYDLTYATDVDTHETGAALLNHQGFLDVGHDEYWSGTMMDNVTAARNAGVGLAFLSGNSAYWQIRMESSAQGASDRVIVCYKSAALDPVQNASTTVKFRDPTVNRPEQQLMGVMSTGVQANGVAPAPYVVQNSGNWAYTSAGVNDGDSIPHIVGYETDRQVSGYPTPTAIPGTYTLLSTSPYTTSDGSADYANSSIYQASSGAWVFAAGSIEWSWGLDNYGNHNFADPRIAQLTANVLDRIAAGVPVPPPSAPSSLVAHATAADTVALTWSDNANNEEHQVLQRSATSTFVAVTNIELAAGATSYGDAGLQPRVYYYRVQAVDAGGGSPYSNVSGVSMQPYASHVLANSGLLSFWRLGESSGNRATDSAGTATGTYQGGGVSLGQPGAIVGDPDTAVGFDAATAKVSLPAMPSTGDFTVEGWTNLPAGWTGANSTVYGTSGNVRLLARPGGTASATEVYVGVWLNGVEYSLQPRATVSNTDRWVHWAMTRNGGTLTVYRNGVQLAQRTDLPATATANISGWIGAQGGTSYYATGRIDDVAVYSSALSAASVVDDYTAGLNGLAPPPPPPPPATPAYRTAVLAEPSLMSYWRLGEASGATAVDSKNATNGSYLGAVSLGQLGAVTNDPDTAAGFDGSSARVSTPSLPLVTDFTIEGWSLLPSGWTGANSTVYGTSGMVRVLTRPGGSLSTTVYAGVWLGGTEYVLQPRLTVANTGVWTYWAMTRSGSTLTVYRNGSQVAQRTDLPASTTANVNGWIGAQGGTTYYAVGRIDEVAVYSSALGPATVQAHYTDALTGQSP